MRAAAAALAALVTCPLLAAFASAPPVHAATAGGAFSGYLTGVSCPSPSDCWAMGQASDGFAVTDHWTGSAWAVVHIPGPSGATFSYLPSVSCPSTSYCWAVGQYKVASGDFLPYAEHWNGTAWSVTAMPRPARAINTLPIDVSCSSAASCWAVGTADLVPLFERWNGHAWTIVPTPAIPQRNIPERVACVSASDCWATGLSDTNGALTAHWDGTAWAPVTTPVTSGGDELLGVSCSSAAACMAVGESTAYNHPLAVRWNGSAWTVSLAGKARAGLNGLSCTSGLRCAAVGATATNGGLAFSEIWTGSRWRQATVQVPAGNSGLVGVSCPAPADCWAVGNQLQATHRSSLIEHWNGTAWSLVP